MTIRALPRFVVAVAVVFVGVCGAVLLGLADLALVATPWFVLLVLGLGQPALRSPALTVRAEQERVVAGDNVDLTTAVHHPDPVSVRLLPVLRRPSRADRGNQNTALAGRVVAVTATAPAEVHECVRFDRWGAWRLEGHRVEVRPRYGLFVTETTDTTGVNVQVHPRTEHLRSLLAPRYLRRAAGRHTGRTRGSGIEFADIRPFAAGDEVRAINWRATARRGSLQVTERHPEQAADVILLLDSFIEAGHNVERVLTLTVNAALAASVGQTEVTGRVGVVEFGGLVRWLAPRLGRLQLHRLTDFVLGSLTFSNESAKELPVLAPSVWPARSLVIAISPLLDQRFLDALVEARRRGHDVAVIEVDAFDPGDLGPQTDVQRIASRLAVAERVSMRRQLVDGDVAVVLWRSGAPVEEPLSALAGIRQRMRARR